MRAAGAARGRQGRRSRCRAPSAGRALAEAQAGRRDRLRRVHQRRHPAPPELPRPARRQAGERGGSRDAAKLRKPRRRPSARPPRVRRQDHQPRPRDLSRSDDLTKGDLADYYAAIEALMMVDTARRPISLVRCPQGRGKQCFFQKHDSGTFGEHVQHVPIKEKDGEIAGLSLCRGRRGPARLRPDGDDRVPRLGQPDQAAREARPAGVRPRSRRRARLRRGAAAPR